MLDSSIFYIPQELKSIGAFAHIDGSFKLDQIDLGPDLYTLTKPIEFSLDLSNTGSSLLATGKVWVEAQVDCARCIEPFDIELTGEVSNYYIFPHIEIDDDLQDDEFEMIAEEGSLDLKNALVAALILDAPLIPLHDEACKGLCASCGANLNTESCSCEDEVDDDMNPFARLKDLKL